MVATTPIQRPSAGTDGSATAEDGVGSAVLRRTAFRPPMRSITASASSVENCIESTTSSPTTSNGRYARSGGTGVWSNPSNVYSANGVYASCALGGEQKSKYLRAGGFAFAAMPDDALIRGVVVSIRRFAAGDAGIVEASVKLAKEDYIDFEERGTGVAVGNTLATVQYGGANDLWGEDYAVPSLFKASNFGVVVGYNNTASGADIEATVYVDHIQVTIYYDEAPDCSGLSEVSAWAGASGSGYGWTNPTYAAGAPDGLTAGRVSPVSAAHNYLTCSDFALATIPSNATILGVRVTVRCTVSGNCQRWHYLQLVDGSVIVGRGKWPFVESDNTTLRDREYGHCEDLWPQSDPGPSNPPTPSMFNDGTFKVIISLENHQATGDVSTNIDGIKVTVWYE